MAKVSALRKGDTCIDKGMQVEPYAVPEGVSLHPVGLEGQNYAQFSIVLAVEMTCPTR